MHGTNQAHHKDIECQMKMVGRLCQAAKINKLENITGNFLVSNISHIELIIYI